jgi:LPLT family lysophospholipid transporter-like MFS transporter
MLAVTVAQFLSALADNALLFAALALLRSERYPEWSGPLLQEFFVGAYVLLAPFAGPIADSFPKGRVMLVTNGIKLLGSLAMALGLNPFVGYGLVGVGAATYSPAKYGILTEIAPLSLLVKANGLIEATTIAAILLGSVIGGKLADWSVPGALAVVTGSYATAALGNLFIPRLVAARPLKLLSPMDLIRDFGVALRVLLRLPDARFSILGTSLFWGAGSTMRFLLVAWVPVALGIHTLAMPSYLNGAVAFGIVIGAVLASRFVSLDRADRALPAGVLIGVFLCLLAITSRLPTAFVLMVLVGASGGFFVIPLNALLQERGHESVGAGNAIAAQNLAENATMLVMIALYTLAARAGAPVRGTAAVFGLSLAAAIAMLWIGRARHQRRAMESASAA